MKTLELDILRRHVALPTIVVKEHIEITILPMLPGVDEIPLYLLLLP